MKMKNNQGKNYLILKGAENETLVQVTSIEKDKPTHVAGNQRQVADIYVDTVSGEDVANFLQEKIGELK